MDENRKIAATLVFVGTDHVASYTMFEASRVTAEGARLTGPLLLEVHEELTLELALGAHDGVRAHARVVRIEPGDPPAMHVRFEELSDEARRKLTHGRDD